jgi:hypothetical protein
MRKRLRNTIRFSSVRLAGGINPRWWFVRSSKHIPETLPEDLDADDITTPGRPDDAGIDMPGSANGTEGWLRRIGIIE